MKEKHIFVTYNPDRFILPEYILDFGYVIHGTVSTHIVKVTNTGPHPVSFRAERRFLAGTGWFMQHIAFYRVIFYCIWITFTELCMQNWVHIFSRI